MGDLLIGTGVGLWLAGVLFFQFVAEERWDLRSLAIALLWPLAFGIMAVVEFVGWVRYRFRSAAPTKGE